MKLAFAAAISTILVGRHRMRAATQPAIQSAAQSLRCIRFDNEAIPAEPSQNTSSRKHLMARELVAHNKPVFDQLHPTIYAAEIGFVAWFVLVAWIFFDRQNDIGLPLAMVSVLLLFAILLPWSLSLVWRKHRMPSERHPHKLSFRDWRAGDFAVWGSKLHSTHAALDMLLPFAAAAFGLTALGVVFLICARTAS
ncbi:MAG TPA: hypothetical protein VGM09_07715 [Bradyrhizobium sp.]|jgi:hypothetical protein